MKILDIIAKKLNIKNSKDASVMTNPVNSVTTENEFLNRMSKHALNLYEKQCDIKKFSKYIEKWINYLQSIITSYIIIYKY